jgi:hypothetical protein
MIIFFALQLGGLFGPAAADPNNNNPLAYIIWFAPIVILMMYGQKFQSWMILGDISKSLAKLKNMKEKARNEAIEYIRSYTSSTTDQAERIDKFLEYFTIMPVNLDPTGIIEKLDHIMRTRDDRIKGEIRKLVNTDINEIQSTRIENILEAATALNIIYKIVRHFYLMGKRTTSMFVLVQLQMVMPLLLQEAEALESGIGAFRKGQPIGDGIGPMVVGKMMVGKNKKILAQDTVVTQSEYMDRKVYFLKAMGPGGTVGRPGDAVQRMIEDLSVRIDIIITIDAALKLEGEKTGSVSEGIGPAIGGIGVEKYYLEQIATKFNIPMYAIIIKQSIKDAITIMRKEISDSSDKVINSIFSLIEDKTSRGQSVLVIGVGNTLGVAQ